MQTQSIADPPAAREPTFPRICGGCAILGPTMHVVDASLNAGALPALDEAWRVAPSDEHRFPRWLGWIGLVGGAGSLIAGLAMFFHVPGFSSEAYVPFAIVISVCMLIAGWYLVMQADGTVASPPGEMT